MKDLKDWIDGNKNPEKFYHVSQTQLSICRYYGGIKYNGTYYVYNPKYDTLTREDIWKEQNTKKKKIKAMVKDIQKEF